jgi:hypothetical protein
VREALAARSERDFISAAPGPRRARAAATRAGAVWRWLVLGVRRRPGAVAGGLAVAAAASAVALNALTFQTRRHPAPLFTPKTGAAAPAPIAAPPLPPVRPAAPPVPPAPAAAPLPQPTLAKPLASPRDPIGDMIRAGDGASNAARATEAKADQQRPVAAAQRALTKLGYGPLKADGIMGEGTHQALERFERDRRLAVTRDLSPRTIRELSAQAGVPIE